MAERATESSIASLAGVRVLVVDDEPRLAAAVATALRKNGCRCTVAGDGQEALDVFERHGADVVVSDRRMPRLDGDELLDRLLDKDPRLPVIMITAYGDVPSAVAAMRRGAFNYLTKPFDLDELRCVVAQAAEMSRLRRESTRLRRELADRRGGAMVAESPAMLEVLEWVDRAADGDATVLIEGESGSGKELVARRLHFAGARAGGPFVALNCKALAAGVLESELFGHEKGAFTGAAERRAGCFERADGGTLFLDEIGEIDAAFQAKLLRVLQEKEVQRVGGDRTIPVDVRVVSATHRDLRQAVADGTFRQDLFYRLRVLPIHLPPLRRRPEDVLPLARLFLRRRQGHLRAGRSGLAGRAHGAQNHGARSHAARKPAAGHLVFSAEAEAALLRHPWPGNVRELENVVERAVMLARGELIQEEELLLDDPMVRPGAPSSNPIGEPDETLQEVLDRTALEHIELVLARHDGRKADAARQLGIDRTTLFRWLRRLRPDEP